MEFRGSIAFLYLLKNLYIEIVNKFIRAINILHNKGTEVCNGI